MPYLGNVPAEAYTNTVKDSFNGDASTTAFTLSQPSTTNNLRVVVENVIQDPTVAYTVSGTTLTFTSAPPVGTANIYAVHLGPATMTAVPPSEINNATNFTDGITVDKDGAAVITADRASSDGTIIDLQKSGTSVGSIGANGGRVYTSGPSYGAKFGNVSLDPCTSTGSTADNAYDLGGSSVRWKDLYLSGGVYLGGTGSDNKISDYEVGSWTPGMTLGGLSSGISFSTNAGRYIKIGSLVHVFGVIVLSSKGSNTGVARITGLPFTVNDWTSATALDSGSGVVGYYGFVSGVYGGMAVIGRGGSTELDFFFSTSSGAQRTTNLTNTHIANNTSLRFSSTYYA